jgi:hypothetical protein
MEKKVCPRCKEEKELSEFNKGRSECRLCSKECKKKYRQNNKDKIKEYDKKYRENNKDRAKEYGKEYRQNNKDKIKKGKKEYSENNKDKIKKGKKEYRENNKDKIKEYSKEYCRVRRQSDPLYKLTTNIRNLLKQSFKRNGYTKKSKTYNILGCTYEELKLHIESQWEEWMNWDNYGKYNGEEKYGWDYDHIIPISSGKCEEDIIRLNHHSNLQPLCSYINRCIKKDKIEKGIPNVFDIVE